MVKVDAGRKAADARLREIIAELVEMGRAGEIHWHSPEDRARSTREAEERALAEATTVSDYTERWLKAYAEPKVRPRVFVGYAHALRKVWVPAIGDVELADVTRRQIHDVVAGLVKDGKAASTIRSAIKPLVSMFRFACDEDEILATNPAARIRIPLDATRAKKVVPPTREQVARLIEHAVDQDAEDAITVASATGLRRGELFAARWGDLDYERRLIHVKRSNFGGEIAATKSEAGERVVPMFESVRRVLVARKLRTRFDKPDDYVFATEVGTAHDPGSWVYRYWLGTLTAAKLEGIRWHDLRHYAVSALIAERSDVKLLQAIAGHASATMTLEVDGHLMTERVEEAASRYDPLREAVNT